MRNWIAIGVTAAVGIAIGYALRSPGPKPVASRPLPSLPKIQTIPEAPAPVVSESFPEHPKPSVEAPEPVVDAPMGPPAPLTGNFSRLPTADPSVSLGPLAPEMLTKLPTTDLNADEALVRRLVIQSGGEIVSGDDARDSAGKIGRSLVAETGNTERTSLRNLLRKSLGDRVVLSDAGSVSVSTPELQKADDELMALRRKRDLARIEFLPQAPALRQLEDEYLDLERTVREKHRRAERVRLTILIRPVLSG